MVSNGEKGQKFSLEVNRKYLHGNAVYYYLYQKRVKMFQIISHLSHVIIAKHIQYRLKKLLVKNKIQVLHYLPGRVRLSSPLWMQNPGLVKGLIDELEREPRIKSVTFTKETGSLLILYDNTPLDELSQIELWLKKAENLTYLFEKEGGIT